MRDVATWCALTAWWTIAPAEPWGPSTAPAEPPAAAASAPDAAPPSEPRAKPPDFEGAVGLILAHKPSFSGSSDRRLKPELAGFLRWRRYTLSGAGGFTTKSQQDVERGLDALLMRRGGLRVNLALRFDPGRRESSSGELAGMGEVPATVRARLGFRWEPMPLWSLNLGSSFDILDRVGGYVISGSVSRSFPLGQGQRIIVSTAVAGAGRRYMQAWYGVTPEQSVASGYPEYKAREGLRDVSMSATWRVDFNEQWAGYTAVGASRLLGPAARSPLVRQRDGITFEVALARRF